LRPKLAPARAWLRGEDIAPEEAWASAVVAVRRITVANTFNQVPLHAVLSVGALARYAHFDLRAWVGTEVAFTGVFVGGFVLILQAFHFLWRPALLELAPQLPPDVRLPDKGLSINVRLTLGIIATGTLSGMFVMAWAASTDGRDQRWLVAGLVAIGVATYMTVLIRSALIVPALSPLDDVLAATKRVSAGDFATPIAITSADELGELAASFNEMQRGLREREALQSAFSSYVDPALARRLLAEGDSVFAGEEIDVSVFFADIRGFTTFAESTPVHEAVSTLSRFFAIVVRAISEHGGHTNAYLGDGVLGVFGTPVPLEMHADHAVAAACAVIDNVRAEFGDGLRIGIGVNTGRVIAGTVGGEGKLEFTVIGDPVNVAARVEQLTKQTGDAILLTEATRAALSTPPSTLVDRGEFDVRGKQSRVRLYSLG
jgi:class 3 adenylate cyclase